VSSSSAPTDPEERVRRGRAYLDPVLLPAGFAFAPGDHGSSCNGPFAQGAYVRGDRRLDFSVRGRLGLVTYRVGALTLSHEDLVRAATHGARIGAYPGFQSDAGDEFDRLAQDLAGPATAFVRGDDDHWRRLVAWVAANRKPKLP
jgi:hypothetical protein